jgi:preprotein translocase subunit SecA
LEAGGLYVIGTERHESRRIDNQLRGRSGRQGDPGTSHFFLSLQDDLLRIYGADRMDAILASLGLRDGQSIVHPWISRALEKAQEKVEARNFDIRKNLLKFDNIMNDQRKVIYEQRREVMAANNVSETVTSMRHDVIDDMVKTTVPPNSYPEQWNIAGLKEWVYTNLHLDLPIDIWAKEDGIADTEFASRITKQADDKYSQRLAMIDTRVRDQAEKLILLSTLDQVWKDHLLQLDHLRSGIGLRAYGQRDPLNEYGREAFDLFSSMLDNLRLEVTKNLLADGTAPPSEDDLLAQARAQKMIESRGEEDSDSEQAASVKPMSRSSVQAFPGSLGFNKNDPTK